MNNFPAMTEEQQQELIKRFTLEISRLNNKRVAPQSEDRYFSGGDLWALQAFEIALAALTSPPAPVLQLPAGWKLVPIEPTEAMMLNESGCQHHAWDDANCPMRESRRIIWKHMIEAAPEVE